MDQEEKMVDVSISTEKDSLDNAKRIIPAIASEINKFLNSSASWSALLA